jgi:hypothetical protein
MKPLAVMINIMNIPLTQFDITMWLAYAAIIVLLTSELLYSSPKTSARMLINKRLMRLSGSGLGLAFLFLIVFYILQYSK